VDNPLSNSDTLTSANNHSNKSFKSVKTLKDSKGAHAAHPLAGGHYACPPKIDCDLCYGTGKFLDSDGYVVILTNDEDDDEYEVECQHSMAGNLAEIRRIESESEGYWQIARTGYTEIDSQYEHLSSAAADD
jgi:hypothetical protein